MRNKRKNKILPIIILFIIFLIKTNYIYCYEDPSGYTYGEEEAEMEEKSYREINYTFKDGPNIYPYRAGAESDSTYFLKDVNYIYDVKKRRKRRK